MEGNVAVRLKVFIETEGYTSSQFADACGIPRPTLSQILSGRNKKISDLLIAQIHSTFPNLSILWLLFGEGDIYSNEKSDENHNNPHEIDKESKNVPEDSLNDSSLMFSDNIFERYGVDSSSSSDSGRSGLMREEKIIEKKDDARVINLMHTIERMKANPRKVVQITIYYDDSTFETFFP